MPDMVHRADVTNLPIQCLLIEPVQQEHGSSMIMKSSMSRGVLPFRLIPFRLIFMVNFRVTVCLGLGIGLGIGLRSGLGELGLGEMGLGEMGQNLSRT